MASRLVFALHSNHQLYYSIARGNLELACGTKKKIEDREQTYILDVDDEVKRHGRPDAEHAAWETAKRIELLRAQCQYSVQAVVFAALSAESFINYYGVRKSSATYFKNYLENLTPVQKWLIVPELFNSGRGFEQGKEPLQSLEFLVRTRNELVHAKPKTAVTLDDKGFHTERNFENYYDPSIDTAARCVTTVSDLVKGLNRIDNVVQTDWLEGDGFWRHFGTVTKMI